MPALSAPVVWAACLGAVSALQPGGFPMGPLSQLTGRADELHQWAVSLGKDGATRDGEAAADEKQSKGRQESAAPKSIATLWKEEHEATRLAEAATVRFKEAEKESQAAEKEEAQASKKVEDAKKAEETAAAKLRDAKERRVQAAQADLERSPYEEGSKGLRSSLSDAEKSVAVAAMALSEAATRSKAAQVEAEKSALKATHVKERLDKLQAAQKAAQDKVQGATAARTKAEREEEMLEVQTENVLTKLQKDEEKLEAAAKDANDAYEAAKKARIEQENLLEKIRMAAEATSAPHKAQTTPKPKAEEQATEPSTAPMDGTTVKIN